MIQALLNNSINAKVKLSIPLIANYLQQGHKQADIARSCNITPGAVTHYIKKHYDKLVPLLDNSDKLLALKSKHIANQATDHINTILEINEFNKKDLVVLSTTAGIQIEKYRLLSDKSTQNVSVATLDARIDDRKKSREVLQERLRDMTGG